MLQYQEFSINEPNVHSTFFLNARTSSSHRDSEHVYVDIVNHAIYSATINVDRFAGKKTFFKHNFVYAHFTFLPSTSIDLQFRERVQQVTKIFKFRIKTVEVSKIKS